MAKQRPGKVRDAILAYMRKNPSTAMTPAEIHAEVAKSIPDVGSTSVRSYLALNEGTTFKRVGRGKYRLR